MEWQTCGSRKRGRLDNEKPLNTGRLIVFKYRQLYYSLSENTKFALETHYSRCLNILMIRSL